MEWEIDGLCVRNKDYMFKFSSNKNIKSISLKRGFESMQYNQKNEIPVIEIEINESPCLIETMINSFNK